MTEKLNEDFNQWFAQQKQFKTKTDIAGHLGIPRQTLTDYLMGRVNLTRVNPANLRKLYDLTKIEYFNPENGPVKSVEGPKGKSLLDQFSVNPEVTARTVNDQIVETIVQLYPYLSASDQNRAALIAELKRGERAEVVTYLFHLVNILEQNQVGPWRQLSDPQLPRRIKDKLEERYK